MLWELILFCITTYFSPFFIPKYHWIRLYVCYFMYSWTLLWFPTFLLPVLLLSNEMYSWITMNYINFGTKITNVELARQNPDKVRNSKTGIITVNHQSILDVMCVFYQIGNVRSIRPVLKKEVKYIFPLNLSLWFLGYLFIDRKKPKEAMKTLSEAIEKNDRKLLIFPEGTRNQVGNGLLPFKKGAFKLAIKYKLPILPMVISPYYFIKHGLEFPGGKIIISSLDPIETTDLTDEDVDYLATKTRNVMEAEYFRLIDEINKEKGIIINGVTMKSNPKEKYEIENYQNNNKVAH